MTIRSRSAASRKAWAVRKQMAKARETSCETFQSSRGGVEGHVGHCGPCLSIAVGSWLAGIKPGPRDATGGHDPRLATETPNLGAVSSILTPPAISPSMGDQRESEDTAPEKKIDVHVDHPPSADRFRPRNSEQVNPQSSCFGRTR